MSVIFKEKSYDQLLILVNNLSIMILIIVILLTAFNFILKNRIELLKNDQELLKEEELKIRSLLSDSADDGKQSNKGENGKYNLLISLAKYADNLKYNSLQLKDTKINLKAVSARQNNIFTLVEALENDQKFVTVDLIKINQNEGYYFELETFIK